MCIVEELDISNSSISLHVSSPVMCDLLKDNYVHRNAWWHRRGSIPLVADRANVHRVGTGFTTFPAHEGGSTPHLAHMNSDR